MSFVMPLRPGLVSDDYIISADHKIVAKGSAKFTYEAAVHVPLPATSWLLLGGLGMLAATRRRRHR